VQVLRIVQRLLAIYPGKTLPDSVAEDWLRHLQDQPFVAIWRSYEKQITSPEAFAPKLGQFLEEVKQAASSINTNLEILLRCEAQPTKGD
jgi:hypothetical protein